MFALDVRNDPLTTGVMSAPFVLVGVFLSLAIISFGIWAWRRLRARPGEVVAAGVPHGVKTAVTIAGIAIWVAIIVINPQPPRPPHYEASAIGSLRAINSGQASYSSSCADGGYAVDLADLVKAPPGSSQGFISPDFSHNGAVRIGYSITIERDASADVKDMSSPAATCNGSTHQPASSYFARANPIKPGQTGTRFFATDTRGTIFFSATGPVPNPIPKDAQVVQ